MNLSKKKGGNAKFVPRDAEKFRRFVEATYHSKDREDPYSHFYLKESRNSEKINKMMEEEKQRRLLTEEESKDRSLIEEGNQRRQALQEKIEDILM